MKTYLTLSAIALAAAATLSSGAMAQTAPADVPSVTITPNIGITSDYRFRGISQNNREAALQGGVDIVFKEGFYLGTWASKVSDWAAGPKGNNYELDLYGGYKTEVSGIGLDLGVITYNYPGSKTGSLTGKDYKSNTQEVYVGLTYGIATLKTSYVVGKNYFASTCDNTGKCHDASGTIYYDLTLAKEIAPKLTASAHAGYTDHKLDGKYSSGAFGTGSDQGKFSYADYNVGLTYDYQGFLISGKYHWNDLNKGTKYYANAAAADYGNGKANLYNNAFVVSVVKAF